MADFKAVVPKVPEAPEKTGVATKFSYTSILYEVVKGITLQSLKLPHELVVANMNEPVGTTEEDIILSIARGVDMLQSILDPYCDEQFFEEYTPVCEEFQNLTEIHEIYNNSMDKLACIFRLMDRKSMLLIEDEMDIADEAQGDVCYGDEVSI